MEEGNKDKKIGISMKKIMILVYDENVTYTYSLYRIPLREKVIAVDDWKVPY